LARHGFPKDKEVTFGRLQTYLGLGPGFEVIYGQTDSAKNFAIETLAGVRYMCTPKLAVFVEYKFSYQFSVEIEQKPVFGPAERGVVSFNVPHHRFVVGISYHFKNLYGN
jgi:opacity protein-like surface antigen